MPLDTVVRRYVPEFDAEVGRGFYGAHILMMLHLAEHLDVNLANSYGEGLNETERESVQAALRLLIEEKCVELVTSS